MVHAEQVRGEGNESDEQEKQRIDRNDLAVYVFGECMEQHMMAHPEHGKYQKAHDISAEHRPEFLQALLQLRIGKRRIKHRHFDIKYQDGHYNGEHAVA